MDSFWIEIRCYLYGLLSEGILVEFIWLIQVDFSHLIAQPLESQYIYVRVYHTFIEKKRIELIINGK